MSRRGMPHTQPDSPARAVISAYSDDTAADDTKTHPRGGVPARRADRAKLTAEIAADVIEELRDAVVWLPRQGVRATVAGVIEQALRAELARLREQYRGGRAFPPRRDAPRVGRPVGS